MYLTWKTHDNYSNLLKLKTLFDHVPGIHNYKLTVIQCRQVGKADIGREMLTGKVLIIYVLAVKG